MRVDVNDVASERATQAVQGEMEAGITKGWHRGGQMVVSMGGQRVVDVAVGDARGVETLASDTLCLWMSSGKPWTAVALAQLVEQGELHLDDRVAQIVPGFEVKGKQDITLEHLLMHTGGFRAAPFHFPDQDWDSLVKTIADTPLEARWEVGQTAGYHAQTSWFILADVVQRISGEPIERYLRSHLLEPLNMIDCWLGMNPEALAVYRRDGRIAELDEVHGNGELAASPKTSDAWLTRPRPGGNAIGPASQFVRFYEMLLDLPGSPPGRLGDTHVLESASVEKFTRATRVDTHDKTFRFTMDWGLGFMRNNNRHADPGQLERVPYGFGPHASPLAFGHSGHQSSTAFADPAHQLAVAVVFNGMPGESPHAQRMFRLLDTLYRSLGLPISDS